MSSIFKDILNGRSEEVEPEPESEIKDRQKSIGKRSNPNYQMSSIYLKKTVYRRLKKALFDNNLEFSQWVEDRAIEWLKVNKDRQ